MLPRVRNDTQAAIEVKNIMQDAVANATSGSTPISSIRGP